MKRHNDKRDRLINGADQLFHQQGVNTTTLANIAQLASVPLGNVYYYFKSKESIVDAVIEYRLNLLKELFEEINNITNDAKERIKTLVEKFISNSELITSFGDPIGSLCLELSKVPNLKTSAVSLMQTIISWCETQFTQFTKETNAKQLAIYLVASLQGISLLSATFKNQEYLKEYQIFITNWLETI